MLLQELKKSLYYGLVQNTFRHLELFLIGVTQEGDGRMERQTDGRTNILITHSARHHARRPKYLFSCSCL